jgi:hypothetical protein
MGKLNLYKIFTGTLSGDKTGTPAKTAGQGINNNMDIIDNAIAALDAATEKTANKTTSLDSANNTTFPTTKTVKDYADGKEIAANNFTTSQLGSYQAKAEKGQPNGYAPLDQSGKVPAANLPVSVDEIIEGTYIDATTFHNDQGAPVSPSKGKIYMDINVNPVKQYRWGGTNFGPIDPSPGSTDAVPEGNSNLYFSGSRVLATVLEGLDNLTALAVNSGDSILVGIGKLQAQFNSISNIIGTKLDKGSYTGTAQDLKTLIDQKETPLGAQSKADIAEGNAKLYADGLLKKGIWEHYGTTAEMIAGQETQKAKGIFYVADATGDPSVGSGFAYYEYLGTTAGNLSDYRKLSEEESLDLVVEVTREDLDAKVEDQIVDGVTDKAPSQNAVFDALENKVSIEPGKGLSEANFSQEEKDKLAQLQADGGDQYLPLTGGEITGRTIYRIEDALAQHTGEFREYGFLTWNQNTQTFEEFTGNFGLTGNTEEAQGYATFQTWKNGGENHSIKLIPGGGSQLKSESAQGIANKIDVDLTGIKITRNNLEIFVPAVAGVLPMTVNGVKADPNGNIVVPSDASSSIVSGTVTGGKSKTLTLNKQGGGSVLIPFTDLTAFETIDEGNGPGFRLADRDPANFGNIGFDAVDFSGSDTPSAIFGARGMSSVAFGYENNVAGDYAVSFGTANTATGQHALIFGYNNNGSGHFGFTGGYQNTNGGYSDLVWGTFNIGTGSANAYRVLAGIRNVSNGGLGNITLGAGHINNTFGGTVVGQAALQADGGANSPTMPVFTVGNGQFNYGTGVLNVTSRSNAFQVLLNGTITAPSLTNALITAAGPKALITKEYLETNGAAAAMAGKAFTGSALDLSNIAGNNYNHEAFSAASSYSVSNLVINGFARCFIQTAIKPTITGASAVEIGNYFEANKKMEMVVESPNGTSVEYYFIIR